MQLETSVEWDLAEDRQNLAQFLQTRTGQRLIPKIVDSAPVLLGSGDTNAILIRNGEARGFSACINALLSLSVAEPAPAVGTDAATYPPLDDDARWADGKNLSVNEPTPPQP